MAQSIETKIKRAESTAKTYDVRVKRCWAYAKNGKGDENYGYARQAFEKARKCREIASNLKKELNNK